MYSKMNQKQISLKVDPKSYIIKILSLKKQEKKRNDRLIPRQANICEPETEAVSEERASGLEIPFGVGKEDERRLHNEDGIIPKPQQHNDL